MSINTDQEIVINSEAWQSICKYCSQTCDPFENPSIQCSSGCARKIHVRCLKRGGVPGSLAGDVFFTLLCAECNAPEEETITRNRISWLTVITLTLYNLRENSNGISKHGYFHWKSDISTFVDRNWEYLFQKTTKRRKNWMGTISGTLSHYSGNFFISGTDELGEAGWWRLVDATPPEVLVEKNSRMIDERKKPQARKRRNSPPRSESSLSDSVRHNCKIASVTPSEFSREYVQPSEVLSDFLMAGDDVPDVDTAAAEDSVDISSSSQSNCFADLIQDFDLPPTDNAQFSEMCSNANSDSLTNPVNPAQDPQQRETLLDEVSANLQTPEDTSPPSDASISPVAIDAPSLQSNCFADLIKDFDLPPTNNAQFSEMCSNASSDSLTNPVNPTQDPPQAQWSESLRDEVSENPQTPEEAEETSPPSDSPESPVAIEAPPSLFTRTEPEPYPWEVQAPRKPFIKVSYAEAEYMLKNITPQMLESAPVSIRQSYRDLVVWKLKVDLKLPIVRGGRYILPPEQSAQKWTRRDRLIDRYRSENLRLRSEIRLQGVAELTLIISPYTNRTLRPFIRRQKDGKRPLWLHLMAELRARTSKIPDAPKVVDPASIDYCYVRPHHIAAMNSLCDRYFWPGIDLSECLQYPDFTCVVLWKKLIIGFVVMVPDAGPNEAYISFILTRPEWRRAGIATFMLYHLIQTSPGTDITLHVSASNTAALLYQKFCFKKEEFVQDFYDKYMTPGPGESRHALFMRLPRLASKVG